MLKGMFEIELIWYLMCVDKNYRYTELNCFELELFN